MFTSFGAGWFTGVVTCLLCQGLGFFLLSLMGRKHRKEWLAGLERHRRELEWARSLPNGGFYPVGQVPPEFFSEAGVLRMPSVGDLKIQKPPKMGE